MCSLDADCMNNNDCVVVVGVAAPGTGPGPGCVLCSLFKDNVLRYSQAIPSRGPFGRRKNCMFVGLNENTSCLPTDAPTPRTGYFCIFQQHLWGRGGCAMG